MNKPSPLSSGDSAPHFNFTYPDGREANTAELAGSNYIVYFYPRDNTPGCNKEACAFRDLFDQYTKAGLTVIGVSCDDEESHSKLREKFDLPFPLASDINKKIVKSYGVWGEKKFMGKTFDGIHRTTFLIGEDGKIIQTYPKVKPETHPADLLKDILER